MRRFTIATDKGSLGLRSLADNEASDHDEKLQYPRLLFEVEAENL